VMFIPSGSKNQQAAFFALQQLATDTDFIDTFASAMANVPTTFDSLANWTEASDPKWQTFIGITKDPNSAFKPLTPAGSEDINTWNNFLSDWQTGKVPDLAAGLSQLAQSIDQLNAQAVS